MLAKNNRQNHNYQIVHLLVKRCYTFDGAYALLCDLREDRAHVLAMVASSELRAAARREKAAAVLRRRFASRASKLEAAADINEIDVASELERRCKFAAQDELACINKCIEALQPYRRYAHLTDSEAHECAQREEWLGEMIGRAKKYIVSGMPIPPDEVERMYLHPDYVAQIKPEVERMLRMMEAGRRDELMSEPVSKISAKIDIALKPLDRYVAQALTVGRDERGTA